MRSLSNNMTTHMSFLSTPKLISDLLFIADLLKTVEKDQRNYYLAEIIQELNKNLPANVYLPIKSSSLSFPETSVKRSKSAEQSKQRKQSKYLNRLKGKSNTKHQIVLKDRPHKVLGISTDHAFCLHSKERVPYHIIIKVAFTRNTFKEDSYDDSPLAPYDGSIERDEELDLGSDGAPIEMQELNLTEREKLETTENLLISPSHAK